LKHSLPILITLACLAFPSCAFKPAIDDQGNIAVRSPSKIMRCHGIRQFEKMKRKKDISTDPRYTVPVERVAARLKKVIIIPNAEWEFVVFEDHSPNAFALPGGKVGVNTGIFRIVGNDDDSDAILAAVLGHEISHAAAAHAEQRLYRAAGLILLSQVLWYSLDYNDIDHPEYALGAFALAGYLADALPFSRQQEYESDKMGAIYMARAGYDPRASIELWRRLRNYHNLHGGQKPEFLRTHPQDDSRIIALERFMPIALSQWKKPE
jgi:predicted Zn-dependent protease